MKISTNTAAQVSYKILTNDNNGELIEFADDKNPRLLIFGNNTLIPGFETHMAGLQPGQEFEFSLTPEESFGNYQNELMIDVPKSAFTIDGVLKEDLLYLGNEISMLDNNGNVVSGKVVELNTDNVKMDFNHKLAGSGLYVSGTVHNVRMVTEQDLAPSGGWGSGCGCASNEKTADPVPQEATGCGPGCGCTTSSSEDKVYEDDCPSCGNPSHLRGKGHGDCGCG